MYREFFIYVANTSCVEWGFRVNYQKKYLFCCSTKRLNSVTNSDVADTDDVEVRIKKKLTYFVMDESEKDNSNRDRKFVFNLTLHAVSTCDVRIRDRV